MQSNSRPCYVLPKITPKSFEYQKAKLNHTKLGFAMLDHTCLLFCLFLFFHFFILLHLNSKLLKVKYCHSSAKPSQAKQKPAKL